MINSTVIVLPTISESIAATSSLHTFKQFHSALTNGSVVHTFIDIGFDVRPEEKSTEKPLELILVLDHLSYLTNTGAAKQRDDVMFTVDKKAVEDLTKVIAAQFYQATSGNSTEYFRSSDWDDTRHVLGKEMALHMSGADGCWSHHDQKVSWEGHGKGTWDDTGTIYTLPFEEGSSIITKCQFVEAEDTTD